MGSRRSVGRRHSTAMTAIVAAMAATVALSATPARDLAHPVFAPSRGDVQATAFHTWYPTMRAEQTPADRYPQFLVPMHRIYNNDALIPANRPFWSVFNNLNKNLNNKKVLIPTGKPILKLLKQPNPNGNQTAVEEKPKLETTTMDRSIIMAPLKTCPEGQRMGPDRNCKPNFTDPED